MRTWFSATSPLGKLARLPFRAIPPETILPVVLGPLRGARWIIGSGVLGAWAGTYEATKQRAFAAAVRPGYVVYDVGANVGFYSLLASRLVGPRGRVMAFEPAPANLRYLRRHVALNHSANVEVVDAAVSDRERFMRFDEGPNRYEGRLAAHGGIEVRCVSLDEFASTHAHPDVIKIDVEGGELDVLRGAAGLLASRRVTILLATHSEQLRRECRQLLDESGYSSTEIDGAHEIIARKST